MLAGVIGGLDSVKRREDENMLSKVILGHSLHEVYSNQRIKLAVARSSVECLKKEIGSTDVSKIFSPERVTAVCRKYGLKPGAAMDV